MEQWDLSADESHSLVLYLIYYPIHSQTIWSFCYVK